MKESRISLALGSGVIEHCASIEISTLSRAYGLLTVTTTYQNLLNIVALQWRQMNNHVTSLNPSLLCGYLYMCLTCIVYRGIEETGSTMTTPCFCACILLMTPLYCYIMAYRLPKEVCSTETFGQQRSPCASKTNDSWSILRLKQSFEELFWSKIQVSLQN